MTAATLNFSIAEYHEANDDLLETLAQLDRACFPKPLSAEDFAGALAGRNQILVLVAHAGGQPIGYKLGYEFAIGPTFFSVSGCVLPSHRRQGVAQALIDHQHAWAKKAGFRYVRTHTKNKYREMLLLLIGMGFDVTGVNHHLGEEQQAIVLEKEL